MLCRVASRKVRRGGRARLSCSNASGKATVRIYRNNRLVRKRKTRIHDDGSVRASMRGLRRRREYAVSVWQGATMLGIGFVRVR